MMGNESMHECSGNRGLKKVREKMAVGFVSGLGCGITGQKLRRPRCLRPPQVRVQATVFRMRLVGPGDSNVALRAGLGRITLGFAQVPWLSTKVVAILGFVAALLLAAVRYFLVSRRKRLDGEAERLRVEAAELKERRKQKKDDAEQLLQGLENDLNDSEDILAVLKDANAEGKRQIAMLTLQIEEKSLRGANTLQLLADRGNRMLTTLHDAEMLSDADDLDNILEQSTLQREKFASDMKKYFAGKFIPSADENKLLAANAGHAECERTMQVLKMRELEIREAIEETTLKRFKLQADVERAKSKLGMIDAGANTAKEEEEEEQEPSQTLIGLNSLRRKLSFEMEGDFAVLARKQNLREEILLWQSLVDKARESA